MRAITLRPPWGTAIAEWGRRLENRSDLCPGAGMIGRVMGIHQGRKWTEEQRQDVFTLAQALEGRFVVPFEPEDYPQGLVAVARLVGFVDARKSERLTVSEARKLLAPAADVDHAAIAEAHQRELSPIHAPRMTVVGFEGEVAELVAAEVITSPWWRGPIAWLFDDVITFPPVTVPGRQDIWDLPGAVEHKAYRSIGLERFPR